MQSVMLVEAMRHAGGHAELLLIEGRGHRFGPEGTAEALARSLDFLDAHL
jgi:dipeptidyl aminopeptidase/acylaminoacyl peptidase